MIFVIAPHRTGSRWPLSRWHTVANIGGFIIPLWGPTEKSLHRQIRYHTEYL